MATHGQSSAVDGARCFATVIDDLRKCADHNQFLTVHLWAAQLNMYTLSDFPT
jgi:hypothetical protein